MVVLIFMLKNFSVILISKHVAIDEKGKWYKHTKDYDTSSYYVGLKRNLHEKNLKKKKQKQEQQPKIVSLA